MARTKPDVVVYCEGFDGDDQCEEWNFLRNIRLPNFGWDETNDLCPNHKASSSLPSEGSL